jgi:hypothetical protein
MPEVAERSDAHDDRREDDRGDEHPDQLDETVRKRLHLLRDARGDHSQDRSGDDGEQHPEVEVVPERLALVAFRRRFGVGRGGVGHGTSRRPARARSGAPARLLRLLGDCP